MGRKKSIMWGEIPLGKPFGIELRLHVLFFVTMLLAILSQAWVGPYAVAWAVTLAGPVLLVTIYLHELGHCLASKAVRVMQAYDIHSSLNSAPLAACYRAKL